ncbi:MAG: carboxymuconolactone decarboxylase family protein ['Candidatus Kapabacteria' thiocyanatum]|nr:carboxymuconolactone decarboxylase family protein ['Candidatus Kapabacteria' thiocyanatum]
MSIRNLEPDAYDTLLNLEKYIGSTGLDRGLRELIRIRASQINGCAYCIQLHTTEARELGEEERRIYALSAWHESPLFTPEERVVLAMTDEITDISLNGLTDETYHEARQVFDEHTLARLILQIVSINSWNRIAVATRMVHP